MADPPFRAPWTAEQVAALNRWQSTPHVHPFTCPNPHEDNDGDGRELTATPAGWVCLHCGYTQNWAHPFMFDDPPPPPFPWYRQ